MAVRNGHLRLGTNLYGGYSEGLMEFVDERFNATSTATIPSWNSGAQDLPFTNALAQQWQAQPRVQLLATDDGSTILQLK